jgi:abortive infection alpha-like protein
MPEADPTGGWAKATEATANTSREVIAAARELGGFISGPLGEVVGMLQDHLRTVRFERQVRLADRIRDFLAERGLRAPTRQISLNIGLRILDHATLEEENELQDRWAMLLVNGGDAGSEAEIKRSFVSILRDLGSLDAAILDKIASVPEAITEGIRTSDLPNVVLRAQDGQPAAAPSHEVALAYGI